MKRVRRFVKVVWTVLWALIRLPYTFPRSIVRGVRRHVREAGQPIDIVAYYQRGLDLRRAFSQHSTTLISAAIFLVILLKMFAVAQGNGQTVLTLTQNFSTVQIGAAIIVGLGPYVIQFFYRVFNSMLESHRHSSEVVRLFWATYGVALLLLVSLVPAWIIAAAVGYPLMLLALHGSESLKDAQVPSLTGGGTREVSWTEWMQARQADSALASIAASMKRAKEELDALPEDAVEDREKIGASVNALIAESRDRSKVVRKAMAGWSTLRILVGVGALFYFATAVLSPQPWLPLEKITVSGRSVVG